MFSDSNADQNVFMSGNDTHYHDKNENFFKSPLTFKGSMEQRVCFTESKVPFKNATNSTNLPPPH